MDPRNAPQHHQSAIRSSLAMSCGRKGATKAENNIRKRVGTVNMHAYNIVISGAAAM
jgi:hypothetical protein